MENTLIFTSEKEVRFGKTIEIYYSDISYFTL